MKLIKDYFESKVKNLKEKAIAIAEMEHSGEKGYFREHFIHEVLEGMFPLHIGLGSGIIVDNTGKQSGQSDVICYDKRILPPFIANTMASIYPVETVIAIIEVKSLIQTKQLGEINKNMRKTKEIFNGLYLLFSYNLKSDGSFGADLEELRTTAKGREMLPNFLNGYCILDCCSNFHMVTDKGLEWVFSDRTENLYEVKRFLAISIDNIIRIVEEKYQKLMFKQPKEVIHHDIWGDYIRE